MEGTGVLLVLLCMVLPSASVQFDQPASGMQKVSDVDWVEINGWRSDGQRITFHYNITYPQSYAPMQLLFYKQDQYNSARQQSTCEQKRLVLQNFPSQILYLDTSRCRVSRDINMAYYNCDQEVSFDTSNGMNWYIAASRCDRSGGLTGLDFRYMIDKKRMTWPGYPGISGQSEVKFSLMTLSTVFIMTLCLF